MAKKCNLFLMHFNVRNKQKNVDKLSAFLSELNILPDVLAISKTKLKPNNLTITIDMQGYIFIRNNSSKNFGDVGFFIKENLYHKILTNIEID